MFSFSIQNIYKIKIILNQFACLLLAAEKQGSKGKSGDNNSQTKPEPTWVEELFQGTFTNETRCLNCEAVRPHCDFVFLQLWLLAVVVNQLFLFLMKNLLDSQSSPNKVFELHWLLWSYLKQNFCCWRIHFTQILKLYSNIAFVINRIWLSWTIWLFITICGPWWLIQNQEALQLVSFHSRIVHV